MRKTLQLLAAAVLLPLSAGAHAWWNGDWSERAKFSLDAGPAGADLKTGLSQVPVLVRLHTGNFDFAKAKPDGADLRFVAADDRTPLKHHLEKWDPQAEVALAWVLVPALAPGQADAALWLYYGNARAPSVDDAKGVLDPQHVAVFHFAEAEGAPRDATGYGNHGSGAAPARNPASIIGSGAVFDGGEGFSVAGPALKFSAAAGATLSAWVKVDAPGKGVLVAVGDKDKWLRLEQNGLALAGVIESKRPLARAEGGALAPGAWHHVALAAAGKRLALFLDGVEVASASGELPELAGGAQIGRGFAGEMDEVAISTVGRAADWIRAAAKGQGPEAALVVFGEGETGGGGGASYIGILLNALTVDGWVVVAILGVMLVVSVWVMIAKTAYINRNERENHAFLDAFHRHGALIELPGGFAHSSLSQVWRAGAEEIKGRLNGAGAALLTPKAIESVRATIDAARVREGQKLNRFMVLLTIAISGGPFLGLLGTVVGVMITFAAIAATGDVNVAAIAPGIAAALVATVAGLAVAIPALFGYNYIGTRIKNITADMQVFADEFLARVAEKYEG
jgi:biopolymer transport protein ExbB